MDKELAAIAKVIEHGQFIDGPEVAEFEREVFGYTSGGYCVTCGNGTDALTLALMAFGIGPGDAVFVPAFTFVATAEAVVRVGATPVFTDVCSHTFLMRPEDLSEALLRLDPKLEARAVIPVDLFGHCPDYSGMHRIAVLNHMAVIADAAQSFGSTQYCKAEQRDVKVGRLADATATSFFPSKPLGCMGDGGAVITSNPYIARRIGRLKCHGKGEEKYNSVDIGMNSRLDTIQAAVLLERLKTHDNHLEDRRSAAEIYRRSFSLQSTSEGNNPAWAQYTFKTLERDKVQAELKADGMNTRVYYPVPVPKMPAYANYPCAPIPNSIEICEQVLSIV